MNNYSDEEVEAIKKIACRYIVFGKEVGEEGTPHLQGFILFQNAQRFATVKKFVGNRVHLEAQRGTSEQAAEYCKKDGDFFEAGNPPVSKKKQGEMEKVRYQRAWELAKEGKLEEIDPDIRVRLYGTLKKIRADYQVVPESVAVLEHEWYWGESGAGKTLKARSENPGAYLKNPNKWWCGYKDQEVVIIDEWSPNHEVLASHLKQWADHHPFAAETKGSSLCIRPKKIIITSNFSPEQCFTRPEDLEPIRRRFKVTHFNKQH